METAPAIIVHGIADTTRALAFGRRLTLLSAPGAALYAGCGWWMALVGQARAASPGLVAADLLDCADASGRALAALRIGQRGLVLTPDAPGRPAVADIAACLGAALLGTTPPSLDMAARLHDAQIFAWLCNVTAPRR